LEKQSSPLLNRQTVPANFLRTMMPASAILPEAARKGCPRRQRTIPSNPNAAAVPQTAQAEAAGAPLPAVQTEIRLHTTPFAEAAAAGAAEEGLYEPEWA